MAQQTETLVREVLIPAAEVTLEGTLSVPPGAGGLVVFAHGSGSGRFSPRNRFVARAMQDRGLGTLLFDLLTQDEEEQERWTRHLRFDIGLLAERLRAAAEWAVQVGAARGGIGYFGSSTGAAAALLAAAEQPRLVRAVVSRGGRPDLAGGALARVEAPTLLIVGGDDTEVLRLNRAAAARMHAPVELTVVPGATHLFEEPGRLEQVADLAGAFFARHLRARPEVHAP